MKAKSHLTLSLSMRPLVSLILLASASSNILDLVQVVSIEESCPEPRASLSQDWLRWQGSLREAFTVSGVTGRCLYKHHLAGSNEAADIGEGLSAFSLTREIPWRMQVT